jgi:hypothetical protein
MELVAGAPSRYGIKETTYGAIVRDKPQKVKGLERLLVF